MQMSQSEKSALRRTTEALRVCCAAATAVILGASPAGCAEIAEDDARVRISERPSLPPEDALAAAVSAAVAIKYAEQRPNETGAMIPTKVEGSGFFVADSVVVTAAHVATQACRQVAVIGSDPSSKEPVFRAVAGSPVALGASEYPGGGGDQAVMIPNGAVDVERRIEAAINPLKVGDFIYMLGYGTHYGLDGDATGDPRNGDKPTLVLGIVADIREDSGEAVVLTGFSAEHPESDLFIERGDSGGMAAVLEDGELKYVGTVVAAGQAFSTLEEFAALWDIEAAIDLPSGKYGMAVVDLVSAKDVAQMAGAVVPCI